MGSFSIFHWLIFGIIVAVLWGFFKGLRDIASSSNTTQQPVAAPAFAWPSLDDFDFEVVGEGSYQPAIKALHAGLNGSTITALLVPEDRNPHDDKAVMVSINGLTVGYLSRDDARSFRRRLGAKKLGTVVTSCGAQITGGHTLRNGDQAHFGVKLDIKPFD